MKGLTIIYTGNGKGKTTAAYGSAVRAAGHGFKVRIIQFVKNDELGYGENIAIEKFSNIKSDSYGLGFVGILGDKHTFKEHQAAAYKGFKELKNDVLSGQYELVVADELIGSVYAKLIDEEDLVDLIQKKPSRVTLIVTGRNASDRIIKLADTVTEMREIKHAWQKKIPGQKGIEF